jgi:hypothetical protein
MSEEKQNINNNTPIEKLFEALDENGLVDQPDLKSVELAIKKIEVELKYIRKTLKSYRKTSKPTQELLKG